MAPQILSSLCCVRILATLWPRDVTFWSCLLWCAVFTLDLTYSTGLVHWPYFSLNFFNLIHGGFSFLQLLFNLLSLYRNLIQVTECHVQILSGFLYWSYLLPLVLFVVSLIIFKCLAFTVCGFGYQEVNNSWRELETQLSCYRVCVARRKPWVQSPTVHKLWWRRPYSHRN